MAPGCVDTARFGKTLSRSEARAMFDLPADRPVAVCVRRLVQRMGLEDLIDAAAVMKRHMPDVLIVLAGKGPLDAALKRRIVERGLEAQVRMLGFVPDDRLPHLYRAADLTIVPTTALEGFGLTTIESLAAGTPVLVTPVGGLPEAVERLEPDLVLASCGAPALAHGMTGAFTGQRRLPDAAACRAYARAHFGHGGGGAPGGADLPRSDRRILSGTGRRRGRSPSTEGRRTDVRRRARHPLNQGAAPPLSPFTRRSATR